MIVQIKKILYATDLSKNSSYTFLYAVEMARKYEARIVILHAIEPIRPYVFDEGYIEAEKILERAKKEERERSKEYIRKHLAMFCDKMEAQIGPPCSELISNILVPIGHPVEEILKVSEEERCDAIVMGTHGKGFLVQTFLGSVAGSILERTRKPVFIIPIPSEKSSIDWNGL
jgi:nucleotide-binding universal stress UspA family protein